MREILFRGKQINTENQLWKYGDLLHNGYDYEYAIRDKKDSGVYEVIPDTVGQYTGLTDKNGTKIFEGDILKIEKLSVGIYYYFPPLPYPVNVVVKWDLCAWMWETLCEDKRYLSFPDAWCHFRCEVIGNIHDNPEMLEGGKKQNT